MDQQFLALYDRHVAMAFDRQQRFAEFIERKAPGQDWELDTETGILTFGPKLKFEAQLLGSHAYHNQSWLWAWANKHQKLSLTNRALGPTTMAAAHRLGIPYLNHPGFPLEPLMGTELSDHAGHAFGVVLGSELGFDAYFIAPYDGGEALVLIRDDRLRMPTVKHPLRHVLTIFPQAVAGMPAFNHQAALRNYADDLGIAVTREAGGLKLTSGSDHLMATFDVHDRLTKLDGTVTPEAPPKPAKKKTTAKKQLAKKPTKKITKAVAKKPTKTVAKVTAKTAAAMTKKAAKPVAKTVAKVAVKKAAKPVAKKATQPAKKPGRKR